MKQADCDEALAVALYSDRIQLLIRAIKARGCNSLKRGVTCRPCARPGDHYYLGHKNTSGYYDAKFSRVVICCDQISDAKNLEDTLVHELVHAFDNCRNPGFAKTLELQACSEIRASHLGQCRDKVQSIQRRECIKEDATLSLMSANALTYEVARAIVIQSFESCYNDQSPFMAKPLWERDTN
eukprot:CFRG3287T1